MQISYQKKSITPFLTIGTLIGGLLALLITYFPASTVPFFPQPTKQAIDVPQLLFYFWTGFYGFMFLLAYPNAKSLIKLTVVTLVPSFLAAVLCYGSLYVSFSQTFLLLFSTFALTAFHINYQTNNFQLSYPTLFYAVWDSFVKILIAVFFTALCWMILFSTAEIFKLINITFIRIIITKGWFAVWATSLFISIGFYIPSQIENVIRNIRMIFLYICRYLFIPLAIISVVFIAAFFIFSHHQQFTNTSQFVFLFIPFLCVLFLNGVYQDGITDHSYPIVLHWIARIFLWITPLFTLLGLYSIYFYSYNNIHTNGLNTFNFSSFLNAFLLLIYNITYMIIAMGNQKPWLKPIERCNIVLAIFMIVVTFIMTSSSINKLIPQATINSLNLTSTPIVAKKPAQQFISTQKSINNGSWVLVTNNEIPKNAFVVGDNKGPLYLCRAKINGMEQPGVVRDKQCQIIIDNKITTSINYAVYIEPPEKVYWSTFYPLANGNKRVSVGTSAQGFPLIVCRTIYDNGVYVGIFDNGTCNFIANQKIIRSLDKPQYLYLNAS